MSENLPDDAKALVDAANYATVATIEPDGRPQLSVVWLSRDGEDVLFSTTTNRRKYDNLQRDPRATVLVYDAKQPYKYLEVRGSVTFREDGARDLIDALAKKYMGAERYTADDGTDNVRVTIVITPDKVVTRG
jgi:PPOX class probable F420-dependent enzyme